MEGHAERRVLVLKLGPQFRVVSHQRLNALPKLLNRRLQLLVLRFLIFKFGIELAKFFVFKSDLRLEVGDLFLKLHVVSLLARQLVFKRKKLDTQRLHILHLTALHHNLQLLRRCDKL